VAASRRRSAPPATPPYADRPTAGGLVVPWITARVGDRPYFGSNDPFRIQRALVERLCQICGTPLGRRIHLLVRPADVEAGWTAEPGLHPECRALSVRTCPMLNGVLDRYRQGPPAALAHLSGQPGGPRAGARAEAWDDWWITPSGYRLRWDPDRPSRLLGLNLDVPVLRKSPVRTAAGPDLEDLLDLARRALGLEQHEPTGPTPWTE
jgi:hypothetical protein